MFLDILVQQLERAGIVMLNLLNQVLIRAAEQTLLEEDLSEVLELFKVDRKDLYSGSKKQKVSDARGLFCYLSVRELGESRVNVAKILNISPAAVSKCVERGKVFSKRIKFDLVPEFRVKLVNDLIITQRFSIHPLSGLKDPIQGRIYLSFHLQVLDICRQNMQDTDYFLEYLLPLPHY